MQFQSLGEVKRGATQVALQNLQTFQLISERDDFISEKDEITGKVNSVYRPHQAEFREWLWLACEGRCAISGTKVMATLQAAHKGGKNDWKTNNTKGWLLRSDLHHMMDADIPTLKISESGVIWIDDQHRDESVYRFHGKTIPMVDKDDPSTWPINRDPVEDIALASLREATAAPPAPAKPVHAVPKMVVSATGKSDTVFIRPAPVSAPSMASVAVPAISPAMIPVMAPSEAELEVASIMFQAIKETAKPSAIAKQNSSIVANDAGVRRRGMRM